MKMTKKKDKFGMKLDSGLNQREYQILTKHNIPGLLDIEMHKGFTSVSFDYKIDRYQPLTTFLQHPIDEVNFKKILQSIIEVLIEVEKNTLNLNNLFLDIQYVYVYNSQVYFAYIPHDCYVQEDPLQQFFIDLIQYCHFYTGGHDGFIQEYLSIVEENSYFHYHDLLKWIGFTQEDATEDLDYTTILLNPPKYPYLLRIKTQEKILIDHLPFLIGGSLEADYQIKDNRAISRKHLRFEEEYQLKDLASTNHSYLNGKILESEVNYPFEEGILILGNEEFELYKE